MIPILFSPPGPPFSRVRQAVSGMEHIKESAHAIGRFGHARLNLVVTPGLSSQLVPDLIGEFAAAHPDAMARMEIASSDDAAEWMVSQNHDFGITTTQPASPSFESVVIKDNDVLCVVHPSHVLAQKTIVHAREEGM